MTAGRLRAIFLGTPEFAVPSLEALRADADVLAVITQPDKPKGRGRHVAAPPVAEAARAAGWRVLQPARLKTPEVLETLTALRPDVLVTVAYGKIIPKEILNLPPLGCINVHPSLLPKYRGASPIQAAIREGERETGVTIMYQSVELDAGDIILQRTVPIAPDDTTRSLEATLARVGAEALTEALRLVAERRAARVPQDAAQASYVPRLRKEDGAIDWSQPAEKLSNFVRAMDPWPSAYTWHHGQLLKVWRVAVVQADGRPGTVTAIRPGEGFVVATGRMGLLVQEVQPEGRRRMTADEYARGAHLRVGDRLDGRSADDARPSMEE